MPLKRKIQVPHKEFLRHSCLTAHIRHKDLAIQNFTFSLKVSVFFHCLLNQTKIYVNKVTRNIALLI